MKNPYSMELLTEVLTALKVAQDVIDAQANGSALPASVLHLAAQAITRGRSAACALERGMQYGDSKV